jgi:hypothetical protein
MKLGRAVSSDLAVLKSPCFRRYLPGAGAFQLAPITPPIKKAASNELDLGID